tara:strand:- start:108 stop:281 length:174 start_codon:yes stop_codon:yes gene_type:complete
MKRKEKGKLWDGVSRPSDDLYRKNYDLIFGKKIKKDEELEGYYITKNGIEVLTKKKP